MAGLALLMFGMAGLGANALAADTDDMPVSVWIGNPGDATVTPTPTEGPVTPTPTPTQAPAGVATTAPITALPVTGASTPDPASWLMPAALLIGGLTLMGGAVVARRSMRAR